MFSSSIHVANDRDFILFMGEEYSTVCVCVHIYHIVFIHSSIGLLGWFHILVVVNSAVINMHGQTKAFHLNARKNE